MIEKNFINEKVKDYKIKEYIKNFFERTGYSHCTIQKTPLGEKIVVYSSRPGLIVGRGGRNIKEIVEVLKSKFKMQAPRIEVQEVENPNLDAHIVADKVAQLLLRLGPTKFKYIGHSVTQKVMQAGAIGVEIIMSGRIPSKRSKSWRFWAGYVPKCGDPASSLVLLGFAEAKTKPGMAGIVARILPPGSIMPDQVDIKPKMEEVESPPSSEKKKEEEASVKKASASPKETKKTKEKTVVEEIKEKQAKKKAPAKKQAVKKKPAAKKKKTTKTATKKKTKKKKEASSSKKKMKKK